MHEGVQGLVHSPGRVAAQPRAAARRVDPAGHPFRQGTRGAAAAAGLLDLLLAPDGRPAAGQLLLGARRALDGVEAHGQAHLRQEQQRDGHAPRGHDSGQRAPRGGGGSKALKQRSAARRRKAGVRPAGPSRDSSWVGTGLNAAKRLLWTLYLSPPL